MYTAPANVVSRLRLLAEIREWDAIIQATKGLAGRDKRADAVNSLKNYAHTFTDDAQSALWTHLLLLRTDAHSQAFQAAIEAMATSEKVQLWQNFSLLIYKALPNQTMAWAELLNTLATTIRNTDADHESQNALFELMVTACNEYLEAHPPATPAAQPSRKPLSLVSARVNLRTAKVKAAPKKALDQQLQEAVETVS